MDKRKRRSASKTVSPPTSRNSQLPGVRKEDIELELTENTVTARSLASRDANGRRFTVPLPVSVKIRTIEALYTNGVLEVRIKIKSPERYYKIKIK